MTSSSPKATNITDRELVSTRIVNAPRATVFKLWIDPHHVAQWWGPKGFTTTIQTMEVRPGGVWQFVLHSPDGVNYPNKIIYLDIVEPERLVYDHVSAPQFQMVVTFDDQGDRTHLTVCMRFQTAQQRNQASENLGAVEGLRQMLDRLDQMAAPEGSAQE